MKKFKIDGEMYDILGILDGETFTNNQGEPITLRFALMNHCGMYETPNGANSIKSTALGMKIKSSPDTLILEDAELEFLIKEPVSQPKYVSMIMSQILDVLENAETVELTDKSCLQESPSEKE